MVKGCEVLGRRIDGLVNQEDAANAPVGETAGLGFALGNGHGESVAAEGRESVGAEIVHEVEVDGLGGCAGTPAGAGKVAAG